MPLMLGREGDANASPRQATGLPLVSYGGPSRRNYIAVYLQIQTTDFCGKPLRGQSDCIEIVADLHFASVHSKWTARNVEKCQKNM